MTQQEFNEMFLVAMETYGAAQENDQEVPEESAEDIVDAPSGTTHYSLPMVKVVAGLMSYCKVDIQDLMTEIAGEVATTGLMQSVTQAQFDAIFYPDESSSSSSSSD